MSDLRKAAEMALEALKEYTDVVQSGTDPDKWHEVIDGGAPARKAIEALRQALEQPKREWVELTTEEMLDIVDTYGMQLAEAIEAKLRGKNR